MSNPTDLKHYTNYPVCGFCNTAWDVLYGRIRSATSPAVWVGYCKFGGCDPDVWDFIDEETGWPTNWKLNKRGFPVCYTKGNHDKIVVPKYDNRVFHRRADNDRNAPWRKTSNSLRSQVEKRGRKLKGVDLDDLEWDGFEDDEDEKELVSVEVDHVAMDSATSGPTKKRKSTTKTKTYSDGSKEVSWADDDDLW